ncbi:MAG: hypothetical protein NT105_23680 [Verrucomicrobia bacterium]|nr:hypothetical protein [Verrucomicrobiota bacterium]
MITPPPPPKAGQKVSAAWMRQLLAYARSLQLLSSPTVRITRTPRGQSAEARQ